MKYLLMLAFLASCASYQGKEVSCRKKCKKTECLKEEQRQERRVMESRATLR